MFAVSNKLIPASIAASSVASISRIGVGLLIDPTRPQPMPSMETGKPLLNDRCIIVSLRTLRDVDGFRQDKAACEGCSR